MIITPTYPQRKSIRLQGYDYSQEGLYFVTLCTQGMVCLFGEIMKREMHLNEVGEIAEECWNNIPNHFPHIEIFDYIIMPNHIHGILGISVGANKNSPEEIPFHSPSKTIGSVIRGFKNGVTKQLKECGLLQELLANIYSPLQKTMRNSIWQRNYYEHIIRNQEACNSIADYINHNPAKWKNDEYYL